MLAKECPPTKSQMRGRASVEPFPPISTFPALRSGQSRGSPLPPATAARQIDERHCTKAVRKLAFYKSETEELDCNNPIQYRELL
jgi:hypothetical protein